MTEFATARWPGVAHTPRTPAKARIAKAILKPTINRVPVRLTMANGTRWGAGDDNAPEMRLVRPRAFFARLGADTKIGFGEAYMAGDWTTGDDTDLAELLTPFAARMATIVPVPLQKFRAFVDKKLPHHQRNSVNGSRKNIEAHYDLSNELFTQFLDPSMSYSSAWFEGDETLEQAQMRKIDAVLDDAHVTKGTRMLEIGSGWGALAVRAAQRGAKVTTITISTEQAALAKKRFAEAGVDVDLQLVDYREVTGQYDAIVSVEMIEAVGEEFWPTYFSTIDRLLASGGHVAIQAITMDHHRYLATRNSYGWIQKYIFPGGLLPSLTAIDQVLSEHTTLAVTNQRPLGRHYARTLRQWRDNFNANWSTINAQGFDETFRRMWEFYLAYCEAGFSTGYINVHQISMSRPAREV
ncbi:cyclopropane-fatty-acyl-phospholipid synthase family protein [Aeromicrobium sp.]|uniref:cyclopropane-fatty-acyl-phospholipid synthase family protein n=1 Tax=Aeromicrobium sp. TaxID=1871063 RepID=UPI002FC98673